MKAIISIISISTLMLVSCTTGNNNNVTFEKSIVTTGELFIDSEELKDPSHISLIDNYLVLVNYKGEPIIEIFSTITGKRNAEFLSRGNGPNEVLMVGNIQIIPDKDQIYISDLFKRKLLRYKLRDIIDNLSYTPEIVYERPESSSSLLLFDKLFIGRTHFIAESRDPRGRVLLIDQANFKPSYFVDYPDKNLADKNLDDFSNADLYASAVTISPSLDKIALATYTAGMIDLCTIENGEIKKYWSYNEFYPQGFFTMPMGEEIAVVHTNESKSGFVNACSSNNYAYLLYSGKKMSDKTYSSGNKVYVVSWDGKETFCIELDRQVKRIAVDYQDQILYAITPELEVYKFSLQE